MAAKSSWNTTIALLINAFFGSFPYFKQMDPPPPLNNVGKGDEHVAKHRLHNLRSNLHLLSFPGRNPTLYMWGGGTFSRKDARTLATLLAGVVVLLLQEL